MNVNFVFDQAVKFDIGVDVNVGCSMDALK